jgi:hypothetical protein
VTAYERTRVAIEAAAFGGLLTRGTVTGTAFVLFVTALTLAALALAGFAEIKATRERL